MLRPGLGPQGVLVQRVALDGRQQPVAGFERRWSGTAGPRAGPGWPPEASPWPPGRRPRCGPGAGCTWRRRRTSRAMRTSPSTMRVATSFSSSQGESPPGGTVRASGGCGDAGPVTPASSPTRATRSLVAPAHRLDAGQHVGLLDEVGVAGVGRRQLDGVGHQPSRLERLPGAVTGRLAPDLGDADEDGSVLPSVRAPAPRCHHPAFWQGAVTTTGAFYGDEVDADKVADCLRGAAGGDSRGVGRTGRAVRRPGVVGRPSPPAVGRRRRRRVADDLAPAGRAPGRHQPARAAGRVAGHHGPAGMPGRDPARSRQIPVGGHRRAGQATLDEPPPTARCSRPRSTPSWPPPSAGWPSAASASCGC